MIKDRCLNRASLIRNAIKQIQFNYTSLGRCPADTALPSLGAVVGAAPDQAPHSRYITIRKCAKSSKRHCQSAHPLLRRITEVLATII